MVKKNELQTLCQRIAGGIFILCTLSNTIRGRFHFEKAVLSRGEDLSKLSFSEHSRRIRSYTIPYTLKGAAIGLVVGLAAGIVYYKMEDHKLRAKYLDNSSDNSNKV